MTCPVKIRHYCQYSLQLLMAMSSGPMVQNAPMKAPARRALVSSGIFRSMAARRLAVTQFACSQILRDIHHHVNLLSVQHLQRLRLTCLAGPIYKSILHTLLRKEP